jgi:hypothetical protein
MSVEQPTYVIPNQAAENLARGRPVPSHAVIATQYVIASARWKGRLAMDRKASLISILAWSLVAAVIIIAAFAFALR